MVDREMNLEALLAKAGISKSQFADRLGLNHNTITRWSVSCPSYAIAYLKLLIDYNTVLNRIEFQDLVDKAMEDKLAKIQRGTPIKKDGK